MDRVDARGWFRRQWDKAGGADRSSRAMSSRSSGGLSWEV